MTTSTPCSSVFSSCPSSVSSEASEPSLDERRNINNSTKPGNAVQKTTVVDALVNSSILLLEAIWPTSTNNATLPLRTFIQETLKRSRTSYSTFQVALYYLVRIKDKVQAYLSQKPSERLLSSNEPSYASLAKCPRRTFLAALMVASKYLQDRNYSISAWSKISGLSTAELCLNETRFLDAISWRLFVPTDKYNRWSAFLMSGISQTGQSWKTKLLSIHNDESGIVIDDMAELHIDVAKTVSSNVSIAIKRKHQEIEAINKTVTNFDNNNTNKPSSIPAFMVPLTPRATPPDDWKAVRKASVMAGRDERNYPLSNVVAPKRRRMSNNL